MSDFADPGYLEDRQPRFQISTGDHVLASWVRSHMPAENAAYQPLQLAAVHARIRAAARERGVQLDPGDVDPAAASASSAPPSGGGVTLVTETAGRLLITGACTIITASDQIPRELAGAYTQQAHPLFTYLLGRYVEAEKANANGAYWGVADLEFGEPTVRHGPLNMLHEWDRVVGTIVDSAMYYPEQAADRAHIGVVAAVWAHLYGRETRLIERAAEQAKLFFSMECVYDKVKCESSADNERRGCGAEFSFADAHDRAKVCTHIRERSSQRHLIKPVFIGGAAIVPPAVPAWSDATAEVRREAAALAQQTYTTAAGLPEQEWEALHVAVVDYAHRP